MSKVLIHAGLHKTGTSAIQDFLFHNQKELLKYGFSYPNTEPFNAHHKFANRLKNYANNDLELAIKDVNRTLFTLSNIYKADCLILSSEILCEGVDPRCFLSLKNIFTEIEFHFYVRRQDELLESAYNQIIKQRAEERSLNDFKPYFTDIYQHLNRFKQSIPNSKIIAQVYDKRILINQDITEDFSKKVLGINQLELKGPNKIVNVSLSPVGCLIMMMVNRAQLKESIRLEIMNYLFQELPSEDYKSYKLLSNEDEIKLFNELKESNHLLDKEFIGFKYMSDLEPRINKTYLTYQDAFEIAKEKGTIGNIYEKYGLKLKI